MDAYSEACYHRDWILESAAQLAGEELPMFSEAWQHTAARMAQELRRYATFLDMCVKGEVSGPVVFPSWKEE